MLANGYGDFGRLHRFIAGLAFFVTRVKSNLDYSRRSSRHVDKTTGLRSDPTIIFNGQKTSSLYSEPLRRVRFCDPKTSK
jgi:hypothetical protein